MDHTEVHQEQCLLMEQLQLHQARCQVVRDIRELPIHKHTCIQVIWAIQQTTDDQRIKITEE